MKGSENMRKSRAFRVLLTVFLCCFVFGTFVLAASAGEPETHTVSFRLEEETPYEGQDQVIQDGGYAVIPVTPEKEGCFFLYWKLQNGDRFSFRTPITSDVTLYAEWLSLGEDATVTQIYTVVFRVGDEIVSRQSVEKGEDAIAPTGFDCPTGKTFVAWDADYTNVQSDLTVEATLADAVYTVTVLGLDDEVIDVQEIVHGGNADLSDLPEIPHYSIDEERPYDGVTEGIESDGEIRVNYVPDVYTVRFTSDGVVFGEAQEIAYGDTVTFPEIPAKDNYIFIGWYLDPADTVMYDFNLPAEGSFDLYAKFIPIENKKYTVSFLNYDGSRYGGEQLIEEGQTAFAPGTPVREGYTFVGWYDEDGAEFDFAEPIISDRTITALFRIRAFTVKVMDGDTVISEQLVKYGESAIEPEIAEKDDAIFVGFDGSFSDIRQDTVIRARYLIRTFSVMFFDKNQKKIGGTQYVEYGKSATAPRVPVPEGYAFVGWSDDFSDVREDLVLFPVFQRLEYTVRYFDGTEEIGFETVLWGDGAVGVQPERDGYIFVGWRTSGDAEYDLTSSVTGDLDLYASWQEKPPVVHSVVFTVDGVIWQTQTVADGASAQKPANPAKYGYTFLGWEGDYSNVYEDLTITARFEINTYTVTFTSGGAFFGSCEVEHGSTATPPADVPEREGYRFVRWNYDLETPITEDVTVKAVFAIREYAVRFFVGEEVFSEQSVEYGDYAEIPGTPQLVGGTFLGWYLADDAKFRFSTPITEDTDIYARFETQTCSVVFLSDGEVYATVSVEYGDTVAAPDGEPEKEGWRFVKWDFAFSTPITRNTTVKAVFEEIVHTVTFTVNGQLWTSTQVADGKTVLQPTNAPRIDGYRFVGWDFDFTAPITEDVEVEAVYEAIFYTVTYTVNGKFWAAEQVAYGDFADAEQAGEPDLDGYRFVKWNFDFKTPITEDVKIAAVLEEIFYTVTFKVDGVTFGTVTVKAGATVAEPTNAPEKEGYLFIGWDFDFTTPITGDAEIDAIFEEIIVEPTVYTVVFTVDGEVYMTEEVEEGATASAPAKAPEKDGYRFVGWAFDFNTPITDDVTIVARFEKIEVYYTVTFKVDGKAISTARVKEGDRVAEPTNAPEKEGYLFIGWDFDFTTPITGDAEIDAIFEEIPAESPNLFVLDAVDNGDGTVTYTLRLTGDVLTAGFMGSLTVEGRQVSVEEVVPSDGVNTTTFVVDNEIRFIWSNPVNATEEWSVLWVTVKGAAETTTLLISIDQLYFVNGSGDVVFGEYTVE